MKLSEEIPLILFSSQQPRDLLHVWPEAIVSDASEAPQCFRYRNTSSSSEGLNTQFGFPVKVTEKLTKCCTESGSSQD